MDFSRQQLKVSDIWQINQDVRCYRFVSAHKSVGLEGFKAGQFISLFYEIDGATASRPYSIASSPKEAEKVITTLHTRWENLHQNGYLSM